MNNKTGFTLIESLIYITCATLICLVTASFVSNIYLNSSKNIKFVDRYFEIYKAHDFVVSFLQTAPIDKDSWLNLEKNSFIFKLLKNNLDIGFYTDSKNRLLKKTGKYNFKNKHWQDSGYSIIAKECELEFLPIIDFSSENIMGANLILKDKTKNNISVQRFVSFLVGKKL